MTVCSRNMPQAVIFYGYCSDMVVSFSEDEGELI